MEAWVIGSGTDSDILVRDEIVSRQHCRLTQTAHGFQLQDLESTNGTFVNQRRLASSEAVSVTPADSITLGTSLRLPWPAEAGGARSITIGQGAANQVAIQQPMISSRHARMIVRDGQLLLEDLGSTNGTFLGAERTRIKLAVVQPGDQVHFGSHRVLVSELLRVADAGLAAPARKPSAGGPREASHASKASELEPHAGGRPGWLNPSLLLPALTVVVVLAVVWVSVAALRRKPADSGEVAEGETPGGAGGTGAGSPADPGAVHSPPSPPAQTGFEQGKFSRDEQVSRLKVVLRVGGKGQAMRSPVDLRVAANLKLRLAVGAAKTQSGVRMPTKSSLAAGDLEVAPGEEAWFEFSQISDLFLSDLKEISFVSADRADWVLEAYRIEFGDARLLVSNDSINTRVSHLQDAVAARTGPEIESLQNELKTLREQQAGLAEYLKSGGDVKAADRAQLEHTTGRIADQQAKLERLRAAATTWYTEPRYRAVRETAVP